MLWLSLCMLTAPAADPATLHTAYYSVHNSSTVWSPHSTYTVVSTLHTAYYSFHTPSTVWSPHSTLHIIVFTLPPQCGVHTPHILWSPHSTLCGAIYIEGPRCDLQALCCVQLFTVESVCGKVWRPLQWIPSYYGTFVSRTTTSLAGATFDQNSIRTFLKI